MPSPLQSINTDLSILKMTTILLRGQRAGIKEIHNHARYKADFLARLQNLVHDISVAQETNRIGILANYTRASKKPNSRYHLPWYLAALPPIWITLPD